MNDGTGMMTVKMYNDENYREELKAGVMHICPKGFEHTIINTGNDDLEMLTIVVAK